MQNQMLSQWSKGLRRTEIPVNRGMRRTGHGSSAWTLPLGANARRQPQDGVLDTRVKVASIDARLHGNSMREPEDASITGGTRSLMRRVMGLNVMLSDRKAPKSISMATTRPRVA